MAQQRNAVMSLSLCLYQYMHKDGRHTQRGEVIQIRRDDVRRPYIVGKTSKSDMSVDYILEVL